MPKLPKQTLDLDESGAPIRKSFEEAPPKNATSEKVAKGRPPSPQDSHYSTLNVPFDASLGEINASARRLLEDNSPSAEGDNNGAFLAITAAWQTLASRESRNRYDAWIESRGKPQLRFTILGGQWPQSTADLREALRAQKTGKRVVDNLPSEPGGLLDIAAYARFRVVIPDGRRWANEDRVDSRGTVWVKGVTYLTSKDAVRPYASLGYEIYDRGEWEDSLPPPHVHGVGALDTR